MNTLEGVTARIVVATSTSKAPKAAPVDAVKEVKSADDEQQSQAEATASKAGPAVLNSAVEKLNALGSSNSPALEFELDSDRDVVVIKVINRSTGEVIRELPPEAVVEAATRGDGALPSLVAESA